MSIDAENLQIEVENGTASITLDRPRALHALTIAMCHGISASLEQWWNDDAVTQILLTATPSRAFCAGGDIREALMVMQGFCKPKKTFQVRQEAPVCTLYANR